MVSRFTRSVFFGALASLLVPHLARAASVDELDGFAGVKFGMREAGAKAAAPALELVGKGTAAADSHAALEMSEYKLTNQKFGDLDSCSVHYQFLRGQLVKILFYCGDKKKTEAYLRTTYGDPVLRDDGSMMWGKKRQLIFSPSYGLLFLTDKEINDALQGELLRAAMQAQGGRLPSAPGEAKPAGEK